MDLSFWIFGYWFALGLAAYQLAVFEALGVIRVETGNRPH